MKKKDEIRKIYRLKEEGMFLGVCAGLAEYFEIDANLVRLIFIFLTVGGGSGVLIYLFLALILPSKLEGKVEISKKRIKELAKDIGEKTKLFSKNRENGSFLGMVLVIFGLTALLNQILPIDLQWHWFWPAVLIISGLYLILKQREK